MRYANTNFNTSKFVFDIFVAHNGLLFPKLDDWYKWSICSVSFDIPMPCILGQISTVLFTV